MNIATNILNQYQQEINPLPALRRVTNKPVVFTYAGWGEHTFFMNYDVNIEPHLSHKDAITVCYDEENQEVTIYDAVDRVWCDSDGYEEKF